MHSKYLLTGAGLLSLAATAPTLRSFSRRDPAAVVTGNAAVFDINDYDGVGAGANVYTAYGGDGSTAAGWPAKEAWASFGDMFNANKASMLIGCGNLPTPQANDSEEEIQAIYDGIQAIAAASGVDHRVILATIMQESNGCVRVQTTANAVQNPGLMQSHEGTHSCNNGYDVQTPCPNDEITGMIQDGAQGTESGDGLASVINTAQNDGAVDAQVFYRAARLYNSGSVCGDDLSDACGATQSYASDIANRLTGWLGN